jgi:hypothetical protein
MGSMNAMESHAIVPKKRDLPARLKRRVIRMASLERSRKRQRITSPTSKKVTQTHASFIFA